VPDVHRADRVGGHELDLDAPASPEVDAAVVRALFPHLGDHALQRRVRQPKVDEAGASHLDRGDIRVAGDPRRDRVRERTRARARGLRAGQGDVGRPVTVRQVAGTLERYLRDGRQRDVTGIDPGSDRVAYEVGEKVLHRLVCSGIMPGRVSMKDTKGQADRAAPPSEGRRDTSSRYRRDISRACHPRALRFAHGTPQGI
jgi:hypothetical protein